MKRQKRAPFVKISGVAAAVVTMGCSVVVGCSRSGTTQTQSTEDDLDSSAKTPTPVGSVREAKPTATPSTVPGHLASPTPTQPTEPRSWNPMPPEPTVTPTVTHPLNPLPPEPTVDSTFTHPLNPLPPTR